MKEILHHKISKEFKLQGKLETDYGVYFFYNNIVVMEANEGILLSYSEEISVLLNILNILESKPWAYIANRINSYAVQPIDYKYLEEIPTLKAMAIVTYSDLGMSNAKIESEFFHKAFKTFNNLEEAFYWVKSEL